MNIFLLEKHEIGKPISLRDERVQHLIKVLYKKTGDDFTAGIIGGAGGKAKITRLGNKTDSDGGSIEFIFTPENDGKPLLPLTLIVGFPRPIQLRRLLRDVASIGCKKIFLTGTELGDKSYLKSTMLERGAAAKMLLDGTVQAASTHVPELEMCTSLENIFEALENKMANIPQIFIALDNVKPKMSLTKFLRSTNIKTADGTPREIVAAIGSERGWTEREREVLCAHGFVLCSMGERVLRTETAATAAAAIISAEMWDSNLKK